MLDLDESWQPVGNARRAGGPFIRYHALPSARLCCASVRVCLVSKDLFESEDYRGASGERVPGNIFAKNGDQGRGRDSDSARRGDCEK